MEPSERWLSGKRLGGATALLGIGIAVGWWASSLIGSTAPQGAGLTFDVEMPFDGWDHADAPTNGVLLPDLHDAETQEQRLASVVLADENAELREKVDELTEQAEQLVRDLAEQRVQADLLHVERERAVEGAGVMGPGSLSVSRLGLVDVSEAQGLVALAGGAVEGVRVGMRFHVVRGEHRIAGVRVVEVRERLSAAVIEDVDGSSLLESDHVIPVRAESR